MSLSKTIHGTKVEAGDAPTYHTQRWSDLDHKSCLKRDMYDIVGRGPLCPDSVYAGTNVPVCQRVNVENDNRPKFGEYIPRVDKSNERIY